MPYNTDVSVVRRRSRILLSGVSNTGKTVSLPSFIYGLHDPYEEDEREDAYTYAADKRMVILVSPGEQGNLSLPAKEITPHITSHFFEAVVSNSLKWSTEAVGEFELLTQKIVLDEPDVFAVEGIHNYWAHKMNIISQGKFLEGQSLEDSMNKYAVARLYDQTHNVFGNYIAKLYNTTIPLIVMTTWEDWQAGTDEREAGKTHTIDEKRYLWPSIPGKMAQGIVGRFDARISARLERRCVHKECEESKTNQLHNVWQLLPRGDVMGVGVKGMRKIPQALKEKPYIHQNYAILQELTEKYR